MAGLCDFNPSWPKVPAYNGNLGTFIVEVLEWVFLALGSAIWDLVGGLVVGLACLVYESLLAPANFLWNVFFNATGYFGQYGIWGPVLAVVVIGISVTILLLFFGLDYRLVVQQATSDVDEAEGKSAPSTESPSEADEILSEV